MDLAFSLTLFVDADSEMLISFSMWARRCRGSAGVHP